MSDYIDWMAEKLGAHNVVLFRKEWNSTVQHMQKGAFEPWQEFIKKYPIAGKVLSAQIEIKDLTGLFHTKINL